MTLTARAPAQRVEAFQIEQDDDTPDSPEKQLAAAVLLQAWMDAEATPRTVKYAKQTGFAPERLIRSARRFLTLRSGPWARQRQLFTGALSVDDEAIRLRAVAQFGEEHY